MSNPLFISDKEIDFFNGINKELIQKIIAQKIIYYAISDEHTNKNELYGEAIRKTVYAPVEVNALILYNDPLETTTNFSIDTIYSIEIYFHDFELKERNIEPREGDFVKFGNIFYEIKTLIRNQLTFGVPEKPVMLKATCIVSRASNFFIKEE